jgi:hypothetical protein
VFTNALSWGLNAKAWWFVLMNFIIIASFVTGLMIYYFVIKPKFGTEETEITEKELEAECRRYMLEKVGVEIGDIYKQGLKNVGSESGKKCEIYFIQFKDRDAADHYCVALNKDRLIRRNWCRNPTKEDVAEMLESLADTKERNVVTTREVVDPFGRNVKETTRQPWYEQREAPKEEEGDL